ESARSPRDERIIAGFEDIQRFVETHKRVPRHGEGLDIFERLYAVRLDRLRALPEARSLLAELDHGGLLNEGGPGLAAQETLSDDELLAELEGLQGDNNIQVLRHVGTAEERRAAEEVANRTRCADFDRFKPFFDKADNDLQAGL